MTSTIKLDSQSYATPWVEITLRNKIIEILGTRVTETLKKRKFSENHPYFFKSRHILSFWCSFTRTSWELSVVAFLNYIPSRELPRKLNLSAFNFKTFKHAIFCSYSRFIVTLKNLRLSGRAKSREFSICTAWWCFSGFWRDWRGSEASCLCLPIFSTSQFLINSTLQFSRTTYVFP